LNRRNTVYFSEIPIVYAACGSVFSRFGEVSVQQMALCGCVFVGIV